MSQQTPNQNMLPNNLYTYEDMRVSVMTLMEEVNKQNRRFEALSLENNRLLMMLSPRTSQTNASQNVQPVITKSSSTNSLQTQGEMSEQDQVIITHRLQTTKIMNVRQYKASSLKRSLSDGKPSPQKKVSFSNV
ncbi:mitochondrial intermediate peptidase [Acrasis kona]|uniref:Mitochondrial intermediate peptidase n=1 Tax=Acrasis kona TaxID=1008807 RepID=A0AAW2ZI30_9EUKA